MFPINLKKNKESSESSKKSKNLKNEEKDCRGCIYELDATYEHINSDGEYNEGCMFADLEILKE